MQDACTFVKYTGSWLKILQNEDAALKQYWIGRELGIAPEECDCLLKGLGMLVWKMFSIPL